MAISRGPTIARSGLILSLDAADRNSYPGSGTIWYDMSGTSKNGTLSNGPTFDTANGGSIVFDGTDDIITLPQASNFYPLTSHTLEIWVKSSGLGAGQSEGGLIAIEYGVYMTINSSGNLRYTVLSTEGGFPPGSYVVNNVTTTVTPNLFNDIWRHVVCTCTSGGFYYMYVDGRLLTSGNAGSATLNSTFWPTLVARIGENANNSTIYQLKGNVAAARVYNRQLTSAEVLQNFNTLRRRFNV